MAIYIFTTSHKYENNIQIIFKQKFANILHKVITESLLSIFVKITPQTQHITI